jgi:hypothetical protein
MIRLAFASAILVVVAKSVAPVPSPAYFSYVRDIRVSQPAQQNYFVVDQETWSGARPDLGDLRIYNGDAQVQYTLSVQGASTSTHEISARILNLGSVGGHTEFDLDLSQIAEYDRIRLNLDAKDFVATASVAGSNDLGESPTTELPPSTLYDFTREALGNNSVLKLPTSSFRFLHVSLAKGILPGQVKGATVYNLQESKANWVSVGSCGQPEQKPRSTVISCEAPSKVPLDRIRFQVSPGQANFRRGVSVTESTVTNSTNQFQDGSEITRVRLNRGDASVMTEELDVPIKRQGVSRQELAKRDSGKLTITIDNGDNPPLALAAVQLLSIERRIYFDPSGKTALKLYYGDEVLDPPVYDYARFFHADPAAVLAELGPVTNNDAYRGRPDDRPWSERHNALLWAAMLLAVAVLAILAIRGLKAKALSS